MGDWHSVQRITGQLIYKSKLLSKYRRTIDRKTLRHQTHRHNLFHHSRILRHTRSCKIRLCCDKICRNTECADTHRRLEQSNTQPIRSPWSKYLPYAVQHHHRQQQQLFTHRKYILKQVRFFRVIMDRISSSIFRVPRKALPWLERRIITYFAWRCVPSRDLWRGEDAKRTETFTRQSGYFPIPPALTKHP